MLGLAAAVMTSCSRSETLEEPGGAQQQAIGFSSYVSNTTRSEAQDNDLAALKGEGKGFYVHGKYVDKDGKQTEVFDGGQYSHVIWTGKEDGGGSWGYAPINYWLKDATYKFTAFAPALSSGVSHTFDYENNRLTITDFVADGKTDLVVAATPEIGVAANDFIGNNDLVKLSFRHALSKVRISFKNGWRNDVTLKVNEIKLSGVQSKGTLNTPAGLAGSGQIQLSDWNLASTVDETAPISFQNGNYVDDTGNGDGTNVYDDVYPFENFMIPQALQANTIELSFRVTVSNKMGTGPDLDGEGHNTVVITAKLPVGDLGNGKAAPVAWLPSYSYNYIITISGSTFGLYPIAFDVETVNGWNQSSSEGTGWEVKSTAGSN